ncbi:MAG: Rrf2 family transcriptional regulator [Proteobacteria bacterium]|nr:Rrf2 family transcriptional regulator [Pseudomonadota bacterium]
MLRLSKKADYAIVALSHLRATQTPASARIISDRYHLSTQMLANVLKMLAAKGILNSKRGVAGGYTLGMDPNEIFIGDVIDVIDGPFHISDCANVSTKCDAEYSCPAKIPMMMIHQKIKNFVDNLTLNDIVNEQVFQNLDISNCNEPFKPIATNE